MNNLPSFVIQTPKHLVAVDGGKKRIPWGGSVNMDVFNTPINHSAKKHSSHRRTFGVDYISERLIKKIKESSGRNEISMYKNRKSNNTNVTFYQDAAIALQEGMRPIDKKHFTINSVSELNEDSQKDLMLALQAANKRREDEEKGIKKKPKDLGIGPPPLQNEDVLTRVGRNRNKLDSIVSKMYFDRKLP
jgi:hypothetical protein